MLQRFNTQQQGDTFALDGTFIRSTAKKNKASHAYHQTLTFLKYGIGMTVSSWKLFIWGDEFGYSNSAPSFLSRWQTGDSAESMAHTLDCNS